MLNTQVPSTVQVQPQLQQPLYTLQPQPLVQTQQVVTQPVSQVVAQPVSQVVAQPVPQVVAQPVPQVVAQPVPQVVVPAPQPLTSQATHLSNTYQLNTNQPQTRYRLWQMLVPMQVQQPVPEPQPVAVPEPVVVPQPVEIPAPVVEVPPEPVYTQTYEEPTYTIPETYEEPTYTQTYEEPTYTIPETTYQEFQYQTTTPNVKIYRRGSGITMNEQQSIISCASNNYQNKITPLSNKTAQAVKRTLGGDWLVIVYEQGKPIDFNMTCVQGNDYLYFSIDNMAFQVCRLR